MQMLFRVGRLVPPLRVLMHGAKGRLLGGVALLALSVAAGAQTAPLKMAYSAAFPTPTRPFDESLTKLDSSGTLYVATSASKSCNPTAGNCALRAPTKTIGESDSGTLVFVTPAHAAKPKFVSFLAGFYGSALDVDSAGNVYLGGSATRAFPTTQNAYQRSAPNDGSGFVLKLDGTGSMLFGSFFSPASIVGLLLASTGEIVIVGTATADATAAVAGGRHPARKGVCEQAERRRLAITSRYLDWPKRYHWELRPLRRARCHGFNGKRVGCRRLFPLPVQLQIDRYAILRFSGCGGHRAAGGRFGPGARGGNQRRGYRGHEV
jgi:hypothetical protein